MRATMRLLATPGVPVMFLRFHRPTADGFALTLFVSAAITSYDRKGLLASSVDPIHRTPAIFLGQADDQAQLFLQHPRDHTSG